MSFITGNAETYQVDLPLFEKLGLKKFSINYREKHFVGTVNLDDRSVSIYVSCFPAHFWEFEIESVDNGCFKVSTGTGSLTQYWQSIELIMDGCLVVEKL